MGPLSCGMILQSLSNPLQEGIRFFRISYTRIPYRLILRLIFLFLFLFIKKINKIVSGEIRAYHVPPNRLRWVRFSLYADSFIFRDNRMREPAVITAYRFWSEPISTFGSHDSRRFKESSHVLTVPFIPSSSPLCASSFDSPSQDPLRLPWLHCPWSFTPSRYRNRMSK